MSSNKKRSSNADDDENESSQNAIISHIFFFLSLKSSYYSRKIYGHNFKNLAKIIFTYATPIDVYAAYMTNKSHVCSMKVMYASCMLKFGHVC